MEKQHIPKLVVAQTVPSLRVCFDSAGTFALNNVRVNGIIPGANIDPCFLLGLLNGPVADFVFRRIAKPKDAGWFEANKQFIAPLPIPDGTPEQRAAVATGARDLQRLHTDRRRLIVAIERRLTVARARPRPESWLFAGIAGGASAGFAALAEAIHPGVDLLAELIDGELRLLADGVPVVDRVFVTRRKRSSRSRAGIWSPRPSASRSEVASGRW